MFLEILNVIHLVVPEFFGAEAGNDERRGLVAKTTFLEKNYLKFKKVRHLGRWLDPNLMNFEGQGRML